MMASFVTHTLQETGEAPDAVPVAFIYADYKEFRQQSSVTLLSAITRQLATKNPATMAALYLDDEVPRLDFAEHVDLLQHGSQHVDRFIVVVDAIDEIPGMEETGDADVRYELLHTLAQLDYVSLFCTSRPHIDAALYFSRFSEVSIEARDVDLRIFLEQTLSTSRRLQAFFSKDHTLREEIVTTITQKSSGMFLMARLQAEEVKTILSVRQVRVVLGRLSSKLDDMYEKTLARIDDQPDVQAKLGLRAILWVAHAKRPLTLSEFVHAMSLEADDKALDETSLIDVSTILETCGGLLQVQPASLTNVRNGPIFRIFREDVVGFVHYTTQEYLDNAADHTASHCDIANTSLTYLCLQDFRDKGPRQLEHSRARDIYPFLAYAASFWPAHAELAGEGLRKELIAMLISPTSAHLSKNWLHFALQAHPIPLYKGLREFCN
jgi:hypothetical protein